MTTQSPDLELPSVVVIGGGLAGIAAASQLNQAGLPVVLLEARSQLGGRATSYTDQESGAVIDNCQHVSMKCCTSLQHLCESLGIADAFQTQEELYFIGPDGECTRFRADPLPAPFHLTRAFWKLPYLSFVEKLQFARAVRKLASVPREKLRGRSFEDWLIEQRQSEHLRRRVWEVVLVSALSESLDRIDAAYAQKVFVDGFLSTRQGWKIEIPLISLDELYSQRTLNSLEKRGVNIHTQARVSAIDFNENRASLVTLRDGRTFTAKEFVLAVPQHQLAGLISDHSSLQPVCEKVARMESAPITSVHLWFDRPITKLPHAVFVDRLSQWMFSRGESQTPTGTGFLYQIVISASRHLTTMTQTDVIQKVQEELSAVWQESAAAKLIHARMITERRAVFSVTPGIDELRPSQQSAIPNLQLAGDWTQTGWPATMEGAVRSGSLAAENILRRHSLPVPTNGAGKRMVTIGGQGTSLS